MILNNNTIIAFDGHDGSGKTTISKQFANEINGIYVKPFDGETGERLIYYADLKDYGHLSNFARESIEKITCLYENEILIFDRHWMTVFTLLPNQYVFEKEWFPLPPTILCFSEIESTLERLKLRSEKEYDLSYHRYYIELYNKIGLKFGVFILRTDQNNIKESICKLLDWYQNK